jgi:hypothetical protein
LIALLFDALYLAFKVLGLDINLPQSIRESINDQGMATRDALLHGFLDILLRGIKLFFEELDLTHETLVCGFGGLSFFTR